MPLGNCWYKGRAFHSFIHATSCCALTWYSGRWLFKTQRSINLAVESYGIVPQILLDSAKNRVANLTLCLLILIEF